MNTWQKILATLDFLTNNVWALLKLGFLFGLLVILATCAFGLMQNL
jgi:hypothetical protein